MLEERFRLIYHSKNGSDIKQFSLTWRKFCCLVALLMVMLIGLTTFTIGVFTRLFHNYRIVTLENDREHLQQELLKIKEKVFELGSQLALIETSGDELRNATNLPPIDNDTRQVGVGGPSLYASVDLGYFSDEVNRTSVEVKMDLDRLERAVRLEKSSISEITAKLRERDNQINHFPSIRPVLGGRVNSRFGTRIDPFTGKLSPHYGVDMFMPRGTHILAAADGVVEFVKNNFTPNKSWGKYVVINHGYGYKTLYGHCDSIHVKIGDKVKRWDTIAEVGQTGRAEGYHLHYEVRCNNKKVNPENYIYN